MKLLTLTSLTLLCFAQERVGPDKMAHLKMLVGEWAANGTGGQVEFRYNVGLGMVGFAGPYNGPWKRMMVIHPEGDNVRADFFTIKGQVIRYNLDFADGHTLRFVEASAPAATQRRIVYEKLDYEHLTYLFATASKVTDRGILAKLLAVRPLTE